MTNKKIYSSRVLVLGSTPYKEDSEIVNVASENGVLSLYCHNIHKLKSPLKPLLFVGNLLDVEYTKEKDDFCFAKSALIVNDASLCLQNYQNSLYLMFLSELSTSLFAYGDTYPFNEISTIISGLVKGKDLLSLTLLTLGTFYSYLGLKMNTSSCVKCNKQQNIISYSLVEGGYLCKDCSDLLVDSMDLYVFKYAFMPIDEKTIEKIVPTESGIRILIALYEYLINYFDLKTIKSFSLFLKAIKDGI